jgi:Ala-tRNA(Pro) deacylase
LQNRFALTKGFLPAERRRTIEPGASVTPADVPNTHQRRSDHPTEKEGSVPVEQVKQFLQANDIKYVTITHSTAYTAQEIAALTHMKGRDLAKVVVVKLDGALSLAVVPASAHVDMLRLREISGAKTAELASEGEFRTRFPGCELGAMPPFGNLYQMAVFVDESLAGKHDIAFNAGTHSELIQLAYSDFERLVKPRIAALTPARKGAHAA